MDTCSSGYCPTCKKWTVLIKMIAFLITYPFVLLVLVFFLCSFSCSSSCHVDVCLAHHRTRQCQLALFCLARHICRWFLFLIVFFFFFLMSFWCWFCSCFVSFSFSLFVPSLLHFVCLFVCCCCCCCYSTNCLLKIIAIGCLCLCIRVCVCGFV